MSTEEMGQGSPSHPLRPAQSPKPDLLYCLVSSFNEMYHSYYRGLKIKSKSQTNKIKLLGLVSKVTTYGLLQCGIYKSLNSYV